MPIRNRKIRYPLKKSLKSKQNITTKNSLYKKLIDYKYQAQIDIELNDWK